MVLKTQWQTIRVELISRTLAVSSWACQFDIILHENAVV